MNCGLAARRRLVTMRSMKGRLSIDLAGLPEEGKWFSGELPKEIFDLPEGDAQAVGPLEYELWAQRFGSELLLTGHVVRTVRIHLRADAPPVHSNDPAEAAAISVEIGGEGEIDATEALREEVLLGISRWTRGARTVTCRQKCEIDPRYLSVDKPGEDGLPTPPRAEGDDRWSALDNLKDLKDQP